MDKTRTESTSLKDSAIAQVNAYMAFIRPFRHLIVYPSLERQLQGEWNVRRGRKVAALMCYRSQAHRNYANEEYVRNVARTRGIEGGRELAEVFEVYRLFM